MRIKSLAAAVGLSVVAAVTLGQGVSSANRGSSDPVTQPQIEEPVEETPAPAPEVTPAVPPAEEETPAPAVVEEPAAPVTTTTTRPPAPARAPKPVPVTVVDPAPVVTDKKAAPAPAPAQPKAAPQPADPCHMDDYKAVDVDDLSGSERVRAEKVDRNDNGVVCRKDIPGTKGRGNTGQNSNIKDDQVR
jgi:outer membrane biosynthesis protein TonB